MVALLISPKIESLYGLGRQATKLYGFVWNSATFARLPYEQFSAENPLSSFSRIPVEMFRFQSNQFKKLVPVISRLCNWLLTVYQLLHGRWSHV